MASQEPDKYNRIDAEYNRKFNAGALNKAEQTSATGGGASTDDTHTAESKPNINWATNVTGEKNRKGKNSNKGPGSLKKKSATTAIIITLLIGIFGIGGSMSSLLIPHVAEQLKSTLDFSKSVRISTTYKLLKNKFKSSQNNFSDSSDGKCNIKCKFGSITDSFRSDVAKDFKINTTEGIGSAKGRFIINELEFPDGTKVKSGKEFNDALANLGRESSFKKVFDPTIDFFFHTSFVQSIWSKFKIDKSPKVTGTTKEDINKSFRKAIGLPEENIDTSKLPSSKAKIAADPRMKPFTEISTKYNKKLGKIDSKTNLAQVVCTGYNVGKGVTFAVKYSKYRKYAAFAIVFLVAADQMKAGDANAEVISALGDQLTKQDEYGLAATDSTGYAIAAYGSNSTLPEREEIYSTSISSGLLGAVSTFTAWATKIVASSYSPVHNVCKVANGVVGDAISIGVVCSSTVGAGFAAAAISWGASAVAGIVACGALVVGGSMAIGTFIGIGLTKATDYIVENEMPQLDENTVGVAAGDVIYSGTAQIMGGASATYGMKAGSVEEIKQYAIDTAAIKQREIALARYEAKDTPFDITNQYSFLGSIFSNLNIPLSYNSSSWRTSINSTLSYIPKSFSTIFGVAGAENNTLVDRYTDKCKDTSLELLGVTADALCNPAYVANTSVLDMDIDENTDYMIKNNYIDQDTGDVIPESNYKKYLDNCANRIEPIGETSAGIEDGGYFWSDDSDYYDWATYRKCVDKSISTELDNFSAYTAFKLSNDVIDGTPTSTSTITNTSGSTL